MTVKKPVNKDIENFIDKGADVKANRDKSFKNILIRVPFSILDSIDIEVEKKPWITRTQWIVDAVHEKLNKKEE